MKRFFLIPLLACFSCVMAWGADAHVSSLAELKAALADATIETIYLDQDIEYRVAGANKGVNITRSLTIDGQGFCIKGTSTYVFDVQTSANVVIENLVVWAAKTSKAGRGFLIDGRAGHEANNVEMTLNNVTGNNGDMTGTKLVTNNSVYKGRALTLYDRVTGVSHAISEGESFAFSVDLSLVGQHAVNDRFFINLAADDFAYSLTTNAYGWASYSNDVEDVVATVPAGLKIYKGALNGDVLDLTVVDHVAAGQGVIVKGAPTVDNAMDID